MHVSSKTNSIKLHSLPAFIRGSHTDYRISFDGSVLYLRCCSGSPRSDEYGEDGELSIEFKEWSVNLDSTVCEDG